MTCISFPLVIYHDKRFKFFQIVLRLLGKLLFTPGTLFLGVVQGPRSYALMCLVIMLL